jgi:hypothetical protein
LCQKSPPNPLFIPVLQEQHETDQLANLASADSNLVLQLAILGLDLV